MPPCSAPTLQFRSTTVTDDLCGFALPDHPSNTNEDACKRYQSKTSVYAEDYQAEYPDIHQTTSFQRTKTHTASSVREDSGECQNSFETTDVDHEESLTLTGAGGRKWPESVFDFSSSSSTTAACTGTLTSTTTYESDPPEPGDTDTTTGEWNVCAAQELMPDSSYSKAGTTYTKTINSDSPPDAAESGFYNQTFTVSFGTESAYGDPVFPTYPSWGGVQPLEPGQGYGQIAQRDDGCAVRTLTRLQWRIRHLPTGTCYLKAWIRKTFTPAPTDPPTVPPPAPTITDEIYEWQGTGNPCLTALSDAADAESQMITGSVNDLDAPATAGTTTVMVLKYSCVEGYEPDISDDENPQPNGYPDPAWEPAAP